MIEPTKTKGTAVVRYRYPVYVTVDLDERTVTRVVVDDENGGQPEAMAEGPDGFASLAFAIAESAVWPAWDAGW